MAHFKGHSIITHKIKNGSLSRLLVLQHCTMCWPVRSWNCNHELQMHIFSF